MLLLVDNYDSFVQNLARYFRNLGQETLVVRNDALTIDVIENQIRPAAIVISPGPCTPAEAGCSLEVIHHFAGRIPILGVCLGHQAIGAAFGANVIRAPRAVHGQSSVIMHQGERLFAGLKQPLTVGRYHSLIVEEASLPEELIVTARTGDGVIMAIAHRDFPLFGVQFHPESILTEQGYWLLANFLRESGLEPAMGSFDIAREGPPPMEPAFVPPERPVTF